MIDWIACHILLPGVALTIVGIVLYLIVGSAIALLTARRQP